MIVVMLKCYFKVSDPFWGQYSESVIAKIVPGMAEVHANICI